ncbi:MAG: hypothetical protein ABI162_09500 [Luteolibacter sp.]
MKHSISSPIHQILAIRKPGFTEISHGLHFVFVASREKEKWVSLENPLHASIEIFPSESVFDVVGFPWADSNHT